MIISHLLFLLLLRMAGPAIACLSTQSTSQVTTSVTTAAPQCTISVAPTCLASAPVYFIYDSSTDETQNGATTPAGTCACSNGLNALISPSAADNFFGYGSFFVAEIECSSGTTNFCACDTSGNCYKVFGSSVNSIFRIGPYCASSVCAAYLVFGCTSADPASGLVNTATGAQITCAQVSTVFHFGPGYPFPAVATASCNSCITCATCNGPFTATMTMPGEDESLNESNPTESGNNQLRSEGEQATTNSKAEF